MFRTLLFAALIYCGQCFALEEVTIEIRDHLFYPSLVTIPANQKIRLNIVNHDDTPEEFDSFDLNREKVIFANSKARIFVGPLPPGEYSFFGEFNPNTARGIVKVVKRENSNAN